LALVYLPALLQPLAGDQAVVEIAAVSLREVVTALTTTYPALHPHLLDPQGNLRSHLAIAVDGEIASSLRDSLSGNPEIHFVMAIKGGTIGVQAANSPAGTNHL